MPKLGSRTPKYCLHKATGQAVVTINGRDHYLGPHGTEASRKEYDRLIAEWLANNRQAATVCDLTITNVCAAYWRFAQGYYRRKDGQPTGQISCVKNALRYIRRSYGPTLASDFGPRSLKALQLQMAESGLSRRYINQCVDGMRRMFRWAVSEELLPPAIVQALDTVPGLREGRTAAREKPPVGPVDDAAVDATLPHLSPVVADMVRLQRLTGMRPGELFILCPRDVDRSGDVWMYSPRSHKTEHHGRTRTIAIGPQAQRILAPYLLRDSMAPCFSPVDAVRKMRDKRNAERKTPIERGNKPGSNRRHNPKRTPRNHYNKDSYNRAVRRACEKAGVPKWSPNQLRHSAATAIRAKFGLEGAQVALGHSRADVTQIYAERDAGLAARIAREVG